MGGVVAGAGVVAWVVVAWAVVAWSVVGVAGVLDVVAAAVDVVAELGVVGSVVVGLGTAESY